MGRIRTPVAEQSREAFFRWLNGKNKIDPWQDYGEEGPTDIRLLRDFKFGFTEVATDRGHGDHDDRTRFRLEGVGPRAMIDHVTSYFDDLLVRSDEYRARQENRP
jgi:hypothetical protein